MIQKYKTLLKQYVSFKSISADSSYQDELNQTVKWLQELFSQHDFVTQVFEEYGNPVLLSTLEQNPGFDTVLIYGHYDIQPAEMSDGWKTDPYKLVEEGGKLYARGVMDNKGQLLMHIIAIFDLIEKNELKYNIKFLIEGEEEIGSPNIERFIKDQKIELNSDFVMISDGSIIGDNPLVEVGLRGLVNFELKFRTSHTDLHSGMYGSAAPNAAHELSKFISKIYDENNKIAIPGFFKDVDPIDQGTRLMLEKIPFDNDSYKKVSGTKAILTEPENNYYTQIGLRPSIQVTGMCSGYTGEGVKTIVPSSATAKINIRIVKSQKIERVIELFKDFVDENTPNYVDFEILPLEGVEAVKIDIENNYYESIRERLERVFDNKVLNYYVGGTLPIIKYLQDELKIPIFSVPLGNNDSNMHGVDENLDIILVEKGINFSSEFFGDK